LFGGGRAVLGRRTGILAQKCGVALYGDIDLEKYKRQSYKQTLRCSVFKTSVFGVRHSVFGVQNFNSFIRSLT
jgi:hypothetical protein